MLRFLQATGIRRDGNRFLNACDQPQVEVTVDFITMASGKTFSIYQPTVDQKTYHPRFFTISNITRFDDCADYADEKGIHEITLRLTRYLAKEILQTNFFYLSVQCQIAI